MYSMLQEEILTNYDFLGVTDRMVESLAVMTLLWDLKASDVIVLSAKQSGGYDAMKECFLIPKHTRTPNMDTFFASPTYAHQNPDMLLYYAAIQRLEYTIDHLGYDLVQERAGQIHALRELVETKCRDEAIFPCSATGEAQHWKSDSNCYEKDSGCGYPCVDRVLKDYFS